MKDRKAYPQFSSHLPSIKTRFGCILTLSVYNNINGFATGHKEGLLHLKRRVTGDET